MALESPPPKARDEGVTCLSGHLTKIARARRSLLRTFSQALARTQLRGTFCESSSRAARWGGGGVQTGAFPSLGPICLFLSLLFQGRPFLETIRGFWCVVSAVDVLVDFSCIFFGPFSLENEQEKIHRIIRPKKHDFQVTFLTNIRSRRFLPSFFTTSPTFL